METEIRYYYPMNQKDFWEKELKKQKELKYLGRFYECTDQYNHPMKEYDFYQKSIDGRFRVRKTIKEDYSHCMITWKRRMNESMNHGIHEEEEIEVSIQPDEYENLHLLLTKVLHLELVESYERYRTVFQNEDVEIVLDEYPFGLCMEIENKSKKKNPKLVIEEWVKKLNLKMEDAYPLSWDDKYEELCRKQEKPVERIVRFDKDMPKIEK